MRILALSLFLIGNAHGANCRFLHDVGGRITSRENFELDIRTDQKEVSQCKSVLHEGIEICWHQDSELKNIVFEKFDDDHKSQQKIISKYDPRRNPLPLQLDMNLAQNDIYVVTCSQPEDDE